MTQIFLLSDGTQNQQYWPDPGNWNPADNTVEALTNGSSGSGFSNVGPGFPGGGGGGGAYGIGRNLTLTFPVPFWVPPGNSSNTAVNFGMTGEFSTITDPGPNIVSLASPSTAAGSGTPGAPASGTLYWPAAGYQLGGSGGAGQVGGNGGGGGGGSGGPHGAGSNGTGGAAGAVSGGAADAGNTPMSLAGQPGNNGTQWDPSHGCGSGGGGTVNTGAAGGNYGGAGGGGGNTGIAGAPGLIIINYTPLVPAPPNNQAIIMA